MKLNQTKYSWEQDEISKVRNGWKLESKVFERQTRGKLQHELMEKGDCTRTKSFAFSSFNYI